LIVVSRHPGRADVNIAARVHAHLTDDAQLDQAAGAFQSIFDGSSTLGGTLGELPATR
jgi:hypothetical protein